jgi:filamentous hemagglutinin
VVEQRLGLAPGYLSSADTMAVSIAPSEIRGLRMPSGNEPGATLQWIPGGYTRGGMPEAVMDFAYRPRAVEVDLRSYMK